MVLDLRGNQGFEISNWVLSGQILGVKLRSSPPIRNNFKLSFTVKYISGTIGLKIGKSITDSNLYIIQHGYLILQYKAVLSRNIFTDLYHRSWQTDEE